MQVKLDKAYYLATTGRPFTYYQSLITLEKRITLKILGSYVTNQAAAVFLDNIEIVTKESFAKDFTNTCMMLLGLRDGI